MARYTTAQLNAQYSEYGYRFQKSSYGYQVLLGGESILGSETLTALVERFIELPELSCELPEPLSIVDEEVLADLYLLDGTDDDDEYELEPVLSQLSCDLPVVPTALVQLRQRVATQLNRFGDALILVGNLIADHQQDAIDLVDSTLDCVELVCQESRAFLAPLVTLLVLLSQDLSNLVATWLEFYNEPEATLVPVMDSYGMRERSWDEVRYDVTYDLLSWFDSIYIPIRYRLAFWLTR